jgi:hypothetical protein
VQGRTKQCQRGIDRIDGQVTGTHSRDSAVPIDRVGSLEDYSSYGDFIQ